MEERHEIPERGRGWGELKEEMAAMRGDDLDWRSGRHGAYVWYANDDLEHVLQEAFGMYLVENGLGVRVFHSIGGMEREVLAMVRSLLSAPDGAASIFTSGGTESIFQAIYAAREWARATKPQITEPEFVAPHSAHPALNKAAYLLGLNVQRVPVGDGYGADAEAIRAAITPNTIGIYASAPSYSLGIVDNIPALGGIAAETDLWLHVDACVGGVLGYFVRRSGREVPIYDFAAEGVASISADLHKSGFAAKPASTVHFRTHELRQYAAFAFDDWPHGMYGSLTFTGTRPGGAIAAAWAALNYLGKDGYQGLADTSMRTRDRMIEGLTAIPGVEVFGNPPLYGFAYGVEGMDMRKVSALMTARDWHCPNTVQPPGIHFMATPVHEGAVNAYLADVRECIEEVRAGSGVAAAEARYN